MVSLHRILNPSSRQPAPTKPSSSTEATSPIDATLLLQAAQSEEPTTPDGPTSPNNPTPFKEAAASPSNADQSGNGAPINKLGASSAGHTIHHKGQPWYFRGFEWVEPGVLTLKLQPVGSEDGIQLVREKDVHRECPKELLQLWAAIGRPEPEDDLYEPFKVKKIEPGGRVLTHWTGFDDSPENMSMEPLSTIQAIAPELLIEYREKRARDGAKRRPAEGSKRLIQNAKQPKSQRPKPRAKQRLA
ncbi:hypothetical protein PWT90_07026 [Aphanocladium album]|nr:hypothetical protein PWT90_07026 [Aphanocladium album]